MLKYGFLFVGGLLFSLVSVALSGSEVLAVGCLVGSDSGSMSVVATKVSRQDLFQGIWSGHARMRMN